MEYPRDSHAIVERQVQEDLLRNESAMLFYDATLAIAYNDTLEQDEERPIVLCEACGQHTHAEYDGDVVVVECEHCGEFFNLTRDDARVVSE